MSTKVDDPEDLQTYIKQMTEHQGAIRAFIVSLMPGSPDVGDVLQETNLVLWNKRGRFRKDTNFLAWAFTIARYEVMHVRDRAKRDGRILLSDELVDTLAAAAPPDGSQEAYLFALDRCIAKLAPRQRELVEARYMPGRSVEQHAVQTGKSPGSLRVALLRIREALRRCIETSEAGGAA